MPAAAIMRIANENAQTRIDDGPTRQSQIERWCIAYNEESVSLRYFAAEGQPRERHLFILPPGPPPYPKLADCYVVTRDQYCWPYAITTKAHTEEKERGDE